MKARTGAGMRTGSSRSAFRLPMALAGLLASAGAGATTYAVTSSGDMPDLSPGNGVCDATAGNFVCTLRAAVQEANAHAGPDSISLLANTTYLLTRAGVDDSALNGDLDVIDSLTITSTGANTVIDGNGIVTGDRVLQVSKCVGNMSAADASCAGASVSMSITGITMRNGRPPNEGGGVNNQGNLTLSHCSVSNNGLTAEIRHGGGIFNAGVLNLSDSTVSDNTTGPNSPLGGGIYNAGAMNMFRSTVSGNTAVGGTTGLSYGGGIYNQGGMLISESTISGNTARRQGGGIFSSAFDARVERSTISGNRAELGGGIMTFGPSLTLVNSTISGNFSDNNGGGIYSADGTTNVFNSTITLNTANADEAGSAIGGGVAHFSGTFNFVNTIIAVNESVLPTLPFPTLLPDDCSGVLTSQGNNIMSDVDTTHCTVNGAYTLVFPNLGPLQDNGGPTLTHALLPGSPAIDAGNTGGCREDFNVLLTNDQRRLPRPEGAACDIGAFERQDRLFQDGFES